MRSNTRTSFRSSSSLLAALTSLFLLASAAAPPSPECLRAQSRELAASASCGDEGSLNYCFSHLISPEPSTPAEQLTAELERCFSSAGCTPAESQIEALWTLQRCNGDGNPSDLRRRRGARDASPFQGVTILAARQDQSTDTGNTETTATNTAKTTARTNTAQTNSAQTNTAKTTTARTTTARTTIAQSTASQSDTAQQSATETPTLETTSLATFTSTTSGPNTSPSPCFTETTIDITSCPVQSTGAGAGTTLSCFPTTAPSQVCAAGLICQVDAQGSPSCMYKHSELGLAGTIVAIFFASAVAISICAICFFCCRERRVQKRLVRAAEAAKIAQEAKTQAMVGARKTGRSVSGDASDRQPLIGGQPGGGIGRAGSEPALPPMPQEYHDGGYQQPHGAEYGGPLGQNPFSDAHDSSHPMR